MRVKLFGVDRVDCIRNLDTAIATWTFRVMERFYEWMWPQGRPGYFQFCN